MSAQLGENIMNNIYYCSFIRCISKSIQLLSQNNTDIKHWILNLYEDVSFVHESCRYKYESSTQSLSRFTNTVYVCETDNDGRDTSHNASLECVLERNEKIWLLTL